MSKIHPVTQSPLQSPISANQEVTKPLACSHKVPVSEPALVTISRETLAKSVGFKNTDFLVKQMPHLSTKQLHVQQVQHPPFLDPGQAASMDLRQRNKTQLPPLQHYSDI